MTKMTAPTHPGEIIRDHILPAFGLTIVSAAEALGVARPGFNTMLNGKRALTHEMALKIEALTGVSAEMLTNAQNEYDLAEARARKREIVAGIKKLQPIAA
ncbi:MULTISPECIES: HigA family addiction module antitoxin [Brevundimonas]|jgi:addiction module HigA family antidote|uniref:Putative HTH-type transcriptional regulator YddM n=1 Tax=Brevundimonas mediterranea TaxID=74329 RepID=A0A7Z9C668_9CAUL|nr:MULTISPECIES: HigA family addiction module antitoxin [Brevundimonas]MCG2662787.1 HigA family addiction module antitoxin [Brevundimonas sp.]OGN47031.1 MAG: addiction module antidote protein, HigA family [Caulobacterales bacterium RIFCSPHIGHO2_12_FULL_68_13]VDC50805.1 putative HTH-type transcriptional regulator YddM [Brevundimonas mediterranea]